MTAKIYSSYTSYGSGSDRPRERPPVEKHRLRALRTFVEWDPDQERMVVFNEAGPNSPATVDSLSPALARQRVEAGHAELCQGGR
jgi:hypothetical protein